MRFSNIICTCYESSAPILRIQICTLINQIGEELMVFQILLRALLWPDVAVGLVGMRLLDLVLALSMLVNTN